MYMYLVSCELNTRVFIYNHIPQGVYSHTESLITTTLEQLQRWNIHISSGSSTITTLEQRSMCNIDICSGSSTCSCAGTATTPVHRQNRAGTSTQLNIDIDCAGTVTVDVQLHFVVVQMSFVVVQLVSDVMECV